ncbi:MAG: ferritin [Bacillota bacterium]
MKLKKEILEALNDQLNAELESAYIYQAMAAMFEDEGYTGFAAWMDMQALEEQEHARKFYDFINERGSRVKLSSISEPPFEWDSPKAAFEAALEHEEYISDRINNLVALARKHDDYATEIFLQWFVNEQVEEEDSVNEIVDKLEKVGDKGRGLYMLEKELGARREQ